MAKNVNIPKMPGIKSSFAAEEAWQVWQKRIKAANKYYDTWANKYKVNFLEEAYYGFQWDEEDGRREAPYVHNAIFVALDIKLPSLLFKNPVYSVKAKPAKKNFDPTISVPQATLKQDVLNFWASQPEIGLGSESELAITDSFFRFGILEVNFSGDFIDNPNAGKPILSSDLTTEGIGEGKVIKEPPKIAVKEKVFVQRIPAAHFRVSTIDHHKLENCAWCGYFDFVYLEDILASKLYDVDKNEITSVVDSSQIKVSTDEQQNPMRREDDIRFASGELVQRWKIWDKRTKKVYYLIEGVNKIVRTQDFDELPLVDLRWRKQLKGFYPIPPVFQWVSPQREINETRESARIHRKRAKRTLVVAAGAFDQNELEILEHGEDMQAATSKAQNIRDSVHVVPNPDLGEQHKEALLTSRSDFDDISGVTREDRGISQGGTATQARIVNSRAAIRESRDRVLVAEFLEKTGRLMLLTAKQKTTLGFWIKVLQDPSNDFGEVSEIREAWRFIKSSQFGDDDFEVDITISSLSPIVNEEEKAALLEFLSILSQFQIVLLSPALVEEVAEKVGYRNRRVLEIFRKLALAQQIAGELQAETVLGQATGNNQLAQRSVAQATPNTIEQIRNQLANQSTQG